MLFSFYFFLSFFTSFLIHRMHTKVPKRHNRKQEGLQKTTPSLDENLANQRSQLRHWTFIYIQLTLYNRLQIKVLFSRKSECSLFSNDILFVSFFTSFFPSLSFYASHFPFFLIERVQL